MAVIRWLVSIGALPPPPPRAGRLLGRFGQPLCLVGKHARGRHQGGGVAGACCPLLRWAGSARKSHGRGLCLERQGQLPPGAPWVWEALGFFGGREEVSAANFLLLPVISYRECMKC
jgi:hypothetical protein